MQYNQTLIQNADSKIYVLVIFFDFILRECATSRDDFRVLQVQSQLLELRLGRREKKVITPGQLARSSDQMRKTTRNGQTIVLLQLS